MLQLASSAPKLNQKNISQMALAVLVDHERMKRRDSIPEEIEEERLSQISSFPKCTMRCDRGKISDLIKNNHREESKKRNSWHSDDSNPT